MNREPRLGAYPAKECPVKTHHRFDPTVSLPERTSDPGRAALHDRGLEHEAAVFAAIVSTRPDAVLISPTSRHPVEDTIDALDDGAPLVLGGTLPDQAEGRRRGRPDILLRVGADEPARYVPGDVKLHHATSGTGTVEASPVSDMDRTVTVPRGSSAHVEGDALQLAHYTRMLQSMGRHPGRDHLRGFIVGGDEWDGLLPDRFGATWIQLDEPLFRTYSRSSKSAMRTALERYDHEFAFRLKVADSAVRGTRPPIVEPVYLGTECDLCDWYPVCEPQLENDASTAFSSWRPSTREWLALRRLGVRTVDQLARLSPTEAFWDRYMAEVGKAHRARFRLTEGIEKAAMVMRGVQLEVLPGTDPAPPAADVEVDFDMENDASGHVYLWGARVRTNQDESTATYRSFVRWDVMTDETERAVAHEFMNWLLAEHQKAAAAGRSFAAFHHSGIELRKIRDILDTDPSDLPVTFVDTCAYAVRTYRSVGGHGLKFLARAAGFEWRDEDPSGLSSLEWLSRSQDTSDEVEQNKLRRRILEYNEDDTAATAALRDFGSKSTRRVR